METNEVNGSSVVVDGGGDGDADNDDEFEVLLMVSLLCLYVEL